MNYIDKNDDILRSLLHYMKGVEPFSKLLSDRVRQRKQWCPFTHEGEGLNYDCYRGHPAIHNTRNYVQKYATCCRYLDCNPFTVANIEQACHELAAPESMHSFDDFDSVISRIRSSVAFIESDATRKLRRFTCIECERLDEAIECLNNYCFYGSVVMAVSALEARIMKIIQQHDKALYQSHFSKATLGQLIQLFDENHYTDTKFKKLKTKMAEKHKPLVALLNQYRVFSAHPKTEQISAQIAEAILKLCFTFMIDVTASPYTAKDLKCADAISTASVP